jgi:hypothetical protein
MFYYARIYAYGTFLSTIYKKPDYLHRQSGKNNEKQFIRVAYV